MEPGKGEDNFVDLLVWRRSVLLIRQAYLPSAQSPDRHRTLPLPTREGDCRQSAQDVEIGKEPFGIGLSDPSA